MTDLETRVLQERVQRYFERKREFALWKHFAEVASHAHDGVPETSKTEAAVVTAMCVLGPSSTIPPAGMRTELLEIVRGFASGPSGEPMAITDFALAYGCGKWRTLQHGYGGWGQAWEGAIRGLADLLEHYIHMANQWLERHVIRYPEKRPARGDAVLLALRLKRPEEPQNLGEREQLKIVTNDDETEVLMEAQRRGVAPGSKAVYTVDPPTIELPGGTLSGAETDAKTLVLTARDAETVLELRPSQRLGKKRLLPLGQVASYSGPATILDWACTCGHTRCAERHRLTGWDPGTGVSLSAFVASAVKGPEPAVKTVSFTQGMYFALLADTGFE